MIASTRPPRIVAGAYHALLLRTPGAFPRPTSSRSQSRWRGVAWPAVGRRGAPVHPAQGASPPSIVTNGVDSLSVGSQRGRLQAVDRHEETEGVLPLRRTLAAKASTVSRDTGSAIHFASEL